MVRVVRFNGEDDEHLLKRFKKSVEKSGNLTEAKDRAYFDKAAKRRGKNKRQK